MNCLDCKDLPCSCIIGVDWGPLYIGKVCCWEAVFGTDVVVYAGDALCVKLKSVKRSFTYHSFNQIPWNSNLAVEGEVGGGVAGKFAWCCCCAFGSVNAVW